MSKLPHQPVLLQEVLEYLEPLKDGIFIDATFGAGGYTTAILKKGAKKVYSIDQDPDVKEFVASFQEKFGSRFHFVNSNFVNLLTLKEKGEIEKADGIVFDLGVSSMQLDRGERGFSFSKNGSLDMRMSKDGLSAEDFLNQTGEEELADVIYRFGDEKYSRRIAKLIIQRRNESPITDTLALAAIIKEAIPYKGKDRIDPATRTFQAIRIYINDELSVLEKTLDTVAELLNPGGRLVVVSFHSLEDRIVKEFLKNNSAPKVAISKYKKNNIIDNYKFAILNKKVITPTEDEIKTNVRSRSARLRGAIRTDFRENPEC